jgi:hypothetical protein
MTKKSSRGRKKGRPVRLSPSQMVQPGGSEATLSQPGAAPARSAFQEADLQEEYRYVITDLRRIGIIAVVMLALLIALAWFLT